jgi:hypothetical protein
MQPVLGTGFARFWRFIHSDPAHSGAPESHALFILSTANPSLFMEIDVSRRLKAVETDRISSTQNTFLEQMPCSSAQILPAPLGSSYP